MIDDIREKLITPKNQVVLLNREGQIIASDNHLFTLTIGSDIAQLDPFFETVSALIVDIISVKDFQNNFIPNLDRLEKIQIDGKLSDDYNLKPGDLLVVRSNGSANLVGRFLLVDKLKTQTSFSGFTIRIRPDAKVIDSKFLAYYLRTDIVRNKLVTNSAGSNIKSLNQGLLSSIKVPLPSLAEQKKIAAKIEKIELQIEAQEKIITQAASQKEAILSKHL